MGGGVGGNGDGAATGYSTGGEACARYLGGPVRSYEGKAATGSTMLEVVVRPPVEVNVEAAGTVEGMAWDDLEGILTRVVEGSEEDEDEEEGEEEEGGGGVEPSSTASSDDGNGANAIPSSGGLNRKLGMDFENVGGLDAQLDDIAVSSPSPLF